MIETLTHSNVHTLPTTVCDEEVNQMVFLYDRKRRIEPKEEESEAAWHEVLTLSARILLNEGNSPQAPKFPR
jgi:hypothetical protein